VINIIKIYNAREKLLMKKRNQNVLFITIIFILINIPLHAEEKKPQGMPPAKVVVAEVSSGMIAPEAEFVGTVFYEEVSEVASEVEGLVQAVRFEEGQRVEEGALLVSLVSDLLQKSFQAAKASYEQTLSDLEKAKKDLERAGSLFKEELISEQSYDDRKFAMSGLEKKAASLEANVERLETELLKKKIRAPFGGIIINKHVDRGEWLNKGSVIATLGKDDAVDIVVDIPESFIQFSNVGSAVTLEAGGHSLTGNVVAIIPKGDISTRTIPVKVRAENSLNLIEGMEAKVRLPVGAQQNAFIVHRDAVISAYGQNVMYAVRDAKAAMIPVTVLGYKGMNAGIQADGLSAGIKVVVKGNERLRDGQEVMIQE
jgi:RND family efflux transporter MFP subunit